MEPAVSDTDNKWLSEHGRSQIEFFLGQADEFLVERARAVRIMCTLFQTHFEGRSGLRLLDVGSGNGIVSRILMDRFPGHSVDLMSSPRRSAARPGRFGSGATG
jgi:2-polyprenyl-3-methyl-5-hydroxy-6-metoxy-1,4-benzoquinol methylase